MSRRVAAFRTVCAHDSSRPSCIDDPARRRQGKVFVPTAFASLLRNDAEHFAESEMRSSASSPTPPRVTPSEVRLQDDHVTIEADPICRSVRSTSRFDAEDPPVQHQRHIGFRRALPWHHTLSIANCQSAMSVRDSIQLRHARLSGPWAAAT